MDLHKKFVKLGRDRFNLSKQLLEMLPEIFRRGVFRNYAVSIEEYAWKYAGFSAGVVQKRLRIEKHIKDKPLLKSAIAKHGLHKVGMVATLVTSANEKFWADRVGNMSKTALFELTKEVRAKASESVSPVPGNEIGTECKAAEESMNIKLTGNILFMFRRLKKELGENYSNEELLRKIFEKAIKAGTERKKKKTNSAPGGSRKVNRAISVIIKRAITERSENKCEYPNCQKLAVNFHHTERFALTHNHENIRHLCKEHHEFAHNGLIKNETQKPENWQLRFTPHLNVIDSLYLRHRQLSQNFP